MHLVVRSHPVDIKSPARPPARHRDWCCSGSSSSPSHRAHRMLQGSFPSQILRRLPRSKGKQVACAYTCASVSTALVPRCRKWLGLAWALAGGERGQRVGRRRSGTESWQAENGDREQRLERSAWSQAAERFRGSLSSDKKQGNGRDRNRDADRTGDAEGRDRGRQEMCWGLPEIQSGSEDELSARCVDRGRRTGRGRGRGRGKGNGREKGKGRGRGIGTAGK